ncbi:MAG: 5'-3' exonuclease H3TH domain-containing protein [Acidobacteriota bacterium]|nr:5'-3' exonuclease H3TH domain-containing protein [Acidobacteriota bacterium]
MQVHLVDGTYELFRAYYGVPGSTAPDGAEVGAVRGLARSLLALLRNEGATHVAVAFDHVVESFRNDLFGGYKTGEGIEPALLAQFGPAEEAAHALGLVVWPMVEFEADDALATAAARFREDRRVERILICTPDKDLAQSVVGERVVCRDRRRRKTIDESGVIEKFGVGPASIPDWLALVGDDADGIPGIPRWGARSSATVLAEYGHIEKIPDDPSEWRVKVRGAAALAENLSSRRDDAALYRTLATLRTDVPLTESVGDLEWSGARRADLQRLADAVGDSEIAGRVPRWRD